MLSLIHIFHIDSRIIEIVKKEVQSFFGGKASAEDVARIIQEKVRMYLNEQA